MLKSWLKRWQVVEVCNKFGTKVNNHGTIEKEKKKKVETHNSVNANMNNPYPNEHEVSLIWGKSFVIGLE